MFSILLNLIIEMIKIIDKPIDKPPKKEFVGMDFNSEIINFVLKNVNTNNKPVKMYIMF